MSTIKDKQSVVSTDPTVELLTKLSQRVYGDVLPEDIKELLAKISIKKGTTRTAFIKPSIEEVTQYLRDNNYVDPMYNADKFWNFYESKGWIVGKAPMKNWRAAISTWNIAKTTNKKVYV